MEHIKAGFSQKVIASEAALMLTDAAEELAKSLKCQMTGGKKEEDVL